MDADSKPAFEVLDAGHSYQIANLGEGVQTLQFIRKDADENGELKTTVEGTTTEAVLAVVANRLQYFLDGSFPDQHTREALALVESAIATLNARTADRQVRGVEGTNQA